jgi:hypothetical protein
MSVLSSIGDWLEWLFEDEEPAVESEATQQNVASVTSLREEAPPPKRGWWGWIKSAVKTVAAVVMEVAHLVNDLVNLALLGRGVGRAAASLFSPTPAKVQL